MSLLLDALKKAAEQKARQARGAEVGADGDSVDDDRTIIADDNTLVFEDKTELSEDSTLVFEDQTELHPQDDHTETYGNESEFNEDDTQFLDDTTHTQQVDDSIDQSEITRVVDETDYDATHLEAEQHDTDYSNAIVDTEDETLHPSFDEDETMSILSNDDVSDFLGGSAHAGVQQTPDAESGEIEFSTDVNATEKTEDISLNLVERGPEDTTLNAVSLDSSDTQLNLSTAEVDNEEMQLVDYDDRPSEQTSTITDQNQTVTSVGVELGSLRHEHTIVRPDVTSTHTYAPDNYDRTLIRPPGDDESKIFAGMKSEEDVLMTPDYAKRVFLSKSSANRVQHYKIYVGIALSILLAIGIFSLFQLQEEYDLIDSTLMPLKRDPMPGILKTANLDEKNNLFENADEVEVEVDTKTLSIVENAQLSEIVAGVEADNTTEVSSVSESTSNDPESQTVSEQAVETTTKTTLTESVASTGANTGKALEKGNNIIAAKPVAKSDSTQQPAGNFQITSSSRVTEKDQLLSEAYAAYLSGNDDIALQKYTRVIEIDSTNRNALLARAAISIQNGDTASAIDDYQTLLLENPKDSLAMSSLISVANTAPQQSESQLKLMIRHEPDSPYLNFVLANIYGAQNRWQEAQSLYFKAFENNPKDPNYAYNLAVSLEHISKPEAAIKYYERALSNIGNGLATFNKDVVDHRIETLRRL